MSLLDPDKSIDYYSLMGMPGEIEFHTPTDHGKHVTNTGFLYDTAAPLCMNAGGGKIAVSDIKSGDDGGRFEWDAFQQVSGKYVQRGTSYWVISPSTGAMQTGSKYPGSPTDMMTTTSSFSQTDNWALSYGFFDSGMGLGGVTNHDQSYVYLTPDMSGWMYRAVQETPGLGDLPFSSWVLPGAHDAGTFDTSLIPYLCSQTNVIDSLKKLFSSVFVAGLSILLLPDSELATALVDFFVTQKDDTAGMLNMGVRYFDFRPGYCWSGTGMQDDGVLYHQHQYLPFRRLDEFLIDVMVWAVSNPTEIAVVSLNFQGFYDPKAMSPTARTVNAAIAKAMTGSGLVAGYASDLQSSYNSLIAQNKRIIFLNQINDDETPGSNDNATKYDSYDPKIYHTMSSGPIIGALNGMSVKGQAGHSYTVMQLQATSQYSKAGDVGAVTNWSKSGSLLMSTKAAIDNQTYPWLLANLRKKVGQNQLVVCLNDFCDNALALHCETIMRGTKKA